MCSSSQLWVSLPAQAVEVCDEDGGLSVLTYGYDMLGTSGGVVPGCAAPAVEVCDEDGGLSVITYGYDMLGTSGGVVPGCAVPAS